tara:strand:- start:48 stop:251 length:204 start_codon:yes stop_codon:yes gene_type:complete
MTASELAPIARIGMRWAASSLVTAGFLSESMAVALMEHDVIIAVSGLVLGVGTEVWYAIAKRRGGAT